jgi:beta-glucosidase
LDAKIDKGALRESDLLAFQIALERGRPGAIMCSYNLINGERACGHKWLLKDVLRRDWKFDGWVMSDWSATKSADMALAGLDQQSGSQMDAQPWFAEPLKALQAEGKLPASRVKEMATRIVTSMDRIGLLDKPPVIRPINYEANGKVALDIAYKGIVLLKNDGNILPLAKTAKSIAVIGGFANMGVPGGGGSAQVIPSTGKLIKIPMSGTGMTSEAMDPVLLPDAPYNALMEKFEDSDMRFEAGFNTGEAVLAAKAAEVAIVFVTKHASEGKDSVDLELPMRQDGLIRAVAAANPNTIVVLETGQPVTMPWLKDVKGVIAAFYPGQHGGQAIADIIAGDVNPSGHLPITFPASLAQLPRPAAPVEGVEMFTPSSVDYNIEGSNIGYRWMARNTFKPLFPFGHGLSYTQFSYSGLKVEGGQTIKASFTIKNDGKRAGADVPQLYLASAVGKPAVRLLGFQRVDLSLANKKPSH